MARPPRAPRAATGDDRDRISLTLPATEASVPLASVAAAGVLQHRRGGQESGNRLAALVAELLRAGPSGSHHRDRVRIHFDVGADVVDVTVELRRRARRQILGTDRLWI